jgi:hypothetical protein
VGLQQSLRGTAGNASEMNTRSFRAKSRNPVALPLRFRSGIPRLRFAPLGMTL